VSATDELDRRVAAIAADRERGATDLAREALDVLGWVAEEDGVDRLPLVAAALARTHPTMAAIKNVVTRVMEDAASTRSRSAAVDACRRARAWLDEASTVVVDRAATVVPFDAAVVTCSYSSATVKACLRAASERRARLLALESTVDGVAYGVRVAAWLKERGVACDVVSDERMADALDGAALVLVGADRVLPDGALVNGSPSGRLAVAARHAGVPFYAMCEAFKLDEERAIEPGFDLVPPRLVTAYITAHGVVAPGVVWAVHGNERLDAPPR
jgi:translation initiation factor eIF-2B subunit delta